ncbi:MAG TPA: hypothetical protein V6D15_21285 [Oculatellaceae cyanobacterium]|jgi:hypothetical protein
MSNSSESENESFTFSDFKNSMDESLKSSLEAVERLKATDTSEMNADQLTEHQHEIAEMEGVASTLKQMRFEDLENLEAKIQDAEKHLLDS